MSSAIEKIVNSYIKLNNVAALEEMKAHRQKLIEGMGDDGPFDRSLLLDQLNGEIARIDEELEKARA